MVQPEASSDLLNDRRAGGIYRTAVRMISEKGFAATSMNDIAEAVELTKPGLYYYVKGKQQLLFSIMSFALDRLDEEVAEPARKTADPEKRLRLIIRQHAGLLTSEPAAASTVAILMDEMRGLASAQRAEIEGRKRAYFDLLRRTLDELKRDGRLLPVDTTVAAFSLLGMVMWLVRWYDPEGRLPSEDLVRDLTEIAAASVLRPEPAAANR